MNNHPRPPSSSNPRPRKKHQASAENALLNRFLKQKERFSNLGRLAFDLINQVECLIELCEEMENKCRVDFNQLIGHFITLENQNAGGISVEKVEYFTRLFKMMREVGGFSNPQFLLVYNHCPEPKTIAEEEYLISILTVVDHFPHIDLPLLKRLQQLPADMLQFIHQSISSKLWLVPITIVKLAESFSGYTPASLTNLFNFLEAVDDNGIRRQLRKIINGKEYQKILPLLVNNYVQCMNQGYESSGLMYIRVRLGVLYQADCEIKTFESTMQQTLKLLITLHRENDTSILNVFQSLVNVLPACKSVANIHELVSAYLRFKSTIVDNFSEEALKQYFQQSSDELGSLSERIEAMLRIKEKLPHLSAEYFQSTLLKEYSLQKLKTIVDELEQDHSYCRCRACTDNFVRSWNEDNVSVSNISRMSLLSVIPEYIDQKDKCQYQALIYSRRWKTLSQSMSYLIEYLYRTNKYEALFNIIWEAAFAIDGQFDIYCISDFMQENDLRLPVNMLTNRSHRFLLKKLFTNSNAGLKKEILSNIVLPILKKLCVEPGHEAIQVLKVLQQVIESLQAERSSTLKTYFPFLNGWFNLQIMPSKLMVALAQIHLDMDCLIKLQRIIGQDRSKLQAHFLPMLEVYWQHKQREASVPDIMHALEQYGENHIDFAFTGDFSQSSSVAMSVISASRSAYYGASSLPAVVEQQAAVAPVEESNSPVINDRTDECRSPTLEDLQNLVEMEKSRKNEEKEKKRRPFP